MPENNEDDDDDLDDIDWDRFISGVYNYCDRWCERCRLREKCLLWHQEQRMNERHLLAGEDPNEPEVAMADVAASLHKTLRLVEKMARELGVDLDNLPPLPEDYFDRHKELPLYQAAQRWSDRLERFAGRLSDELPEAARGRHGGRAW